MKRYHERFISYYQNIETALSSTRSKKTIFCILFLLFGGLILQLNILYPIYGDDWRYSFIGGTNLSERVTSFSDTLQSQYRHYFGHGGRSVVHILAESLLRMNGYWIDIVNSIAYLFFVYIIYKIANLGKKINASLFFFINILIWFYQPAFGQTFLWITGSANYLWGTLIIISFLYFYCYAFITSHKSKDSILRGITFFFAGIIAGWTNENTVIGTILIILCLIIYLKAEKQEVPKWMFWGLIGVLIGFIIMIIAPGNFVRYEGATISNNLIKESKLIYYYTRVLPVIGEFYKIILPIVLIYLLLLVTYIHSDKNWNKKVVFLSAILCLAGIIADLVMIASPEFEIRVLFGAITFYIIAIGMIYTNIEINSLYVSTINSIMIIFAIINFIPFFLKGYKDVHNFSRIMTEREIIINDQIDKPNFEFISHERFIPKTKFTMMHDMASDIYAWDNICYSRYHNIKSFKVEPNK